MRNTGTLTNSYYAQLLEDYLEVCRQDGNKEWTLQFKRSTCVEFFCEITEFGKDLSSIDAETIGKICVTKVNRNKWHIYRMLLHFLFEKGEISRDLSIIVPTYRER